MKKKPKDKPISLHPLSLGAVMSAVLKIKPEDLKKAEEAEKSKGKKGGRS